MQITCIASVQGYAGDVCHPQRVGGQGLDSPDEVLPLAVAVVGVRRVPRLGRGQHQVMAAEQAEEAVAPGHETASEHRHEHCPELVAAYAGIPAADFTHGGEERPFTPNTDGYVGLRLVEGLAAMAKQTADLRDFHAATVDQFRCYLAPNFFLSGCRNTPRPCLS